MSENSYRLLIQKLETSLTLVLHDIDVNKTKKLSFEQIGRFLTVFEIFRFISYSEDFKSKEENKIKIVLLFYYFLLFISVFYVVSLFNNFLKVENKEKFFSNNQKDQERRSEEVFFNNKINQ